MKEKKYNLEEIKTHLLEYLEQITERSKGKNQFICPICNSGTGRNHTGAFTFYPETNSFHCFACGESGDIINLYCELHQTDFNSAVESLSHEFSIPMENDAVPMYIRSTVSNKAPSKREHIYHDENGELFAKKTIIKEADGKKKCFWNLYDQKTKQFSITGLQKQTAPLYHVQSLKHAERIFFTEGEKDAELLESWEETATCTPNGAGQSTWHESYGNYLKGKEIIILTDNDKAGEKYGKTIAKHVYPIAQSVKIIPASAIWSDCPEKGDISDITEVLGEEQAIALLSDAINKTTCYLSDTEEFEYTVKRLSDVHPTPIEFIWYPYIPIGEITIMFAAGGTGKSFLTCGIAADITAGRTLPNPYEPQATTSPQNVLIISAEDNENILHQRLVAARADISRCLTIAPPNQQEELEKYQQFELPCDAHDKKRINALKNAIRKHQAKLVVIDPWAAYVGKDTDMNRANSVRAITAELTVIAKEMNCAFLIVAHVNKKAQADNANDAVAGSADLVNGARSALAVRTFDDVEDRIMIHTKCNYEALGKSICYKIINQGKGKTGRFEWNGFCNITKEDLEDSARSGKKLKDIADDKNDEEENKRTAIDIITQLAVFGKRVNVTYIRFRKLINEQCGDNFLPHRPTKFMNSLLSELRTKGITLENVGSRIRDDFPNGTKGESPFAGFTICYMTDGHLMAEAMPR